MNFFRNSRILNTITLAFLMAPFGVASLFAGSIAAANCPRPAVGDPVLEPPDLRSRDGVLEADLTIQNEVEKDGSIRYCYVTPHGELAPNLRLKPGDLLILKLRNHLIEPPEASSKSHDHEDMSKSVGDDPCTRGLMTATASNLHFHGLTIPPVCHQDDVLGTSVKPGDPPFEYRFQIPKNQPPGLYWYHPHIHGFSKLQVLGGASGALIVDGVEQANPGVAGLPERVLVIRDQDLLHPDAPASSSEPVVPKMLIDRDGDAGNNGTGFGKPAKDLSLNFVPVPWPDYHPARMTLKPGERQFWRVLNASAITYLNLEVLFGKKPQPLGLIALDGAPLNESGKVGNEPYWQTHLGIPPGGRAEFVVQGPPAGVKGLLVTTTVDTGPGGENDPNRALAEISPSDEAPEPRSTLSASGEKLAATDLPWLGDVAPVRVRRLYFSEEPIHPDDPNSAMAFYLTVDGQKPVVFDPRSSLPNIVTHQGTVEDWIIENRSNELHAFHIHQLHFVLLEYAGKRVNEPFLRDTINVPYYNGRALQYPSVRLRMDFRDPNIVGTFVYHCHLLEHEDGGMMGTIRVEPPQSGHPAANLGRQ